MGSMNTYHKLIYNNEYYIVKNLYRQPPRPDYACIPPYTGELLKILSNGIPFHTKRRCAFGQPDKIEELTEEQAFIEVL
jgi:hypothetical protein